MAVTLDTSLGTLLDHPQAKPILEKYIPGITTNPMVPMVKGLTLNALLALPQAGQIGLTKAKVEAALVEINKVIP